MFAFRQSFRLSLASFSGAYSRASGDCNGSMDGGLLVSKFMKRFVKDESGATAIEYGLIAASIAVIIIVAVQSVGTQLNAVFLAIAGAL